MAGHKHNFLRKLRVSAKHFSLDDIGRHYRGGVTKQRIGQLEALKCVSPEVERDYRAAVAAAVQELEDSQNILRIARALAKTL